MGSLFTCPLVLDLSHLFRDPPYLLERVPGEGSKGPQVLVLTQSCVVVDLVTVDLEPSHHSVAQFLLKATFP